MERFDVAVVGAGIMGSSTAYALARRGKRVALFERFDIGHTRGSSHGSSRIFRFSYPIRDYVEMAQAALPLWRAVEEVSGTTLLHPTGGLDVGGGALVNAEMLKACGASAEILDEREVARRWPYLKPPSGLPVVYSPDAATIYADRAWRTFASGAVDAGATLFGGEQVLHLDARADAVAVHSRARVVEADVVVVTAGAWAQPLLADIGVVLDVKPTRETVAFFEIEEEWPPTYVEWGDPLTYALAAPGVGLKAGEHIAGPAALPDEEGGPDAAAVERITEWVNERFEGSGEALRTETCFYTNSADEHFILERHGRVIVGSPCSGHGFKFAPLIGERLADLAVS